MSLTTLQQWRTRQMERTIVSALEKFVGIDLHPDNADLIVSEVIRAMLELEQRTLPKRERLDDVEWRAIIMRALREVVPELCP